MNGSALMTGSGLPLTSVFASLIALPILGLESMSGAATTPAKYDVVSASDAASASRNGIYVGGHAEDLVDGTIVFSRPERPAVPTSAMFDVVVATSSLSILRPEYRFRTFVSTRGRIVEGVLWGDLVVAGHGDPTVDVIRLREVANKIAHSGISRITGAILLDDSFFRTGESGAEEGVDEEGEAAPDEADGGVFDAGTVVEEAVPASPSHTRAFPFSQNRIDVVLRPTRLGAPIAADVVPATGFLEVRTLAKTMPFSRRLRVVSFVDGEHGFAVVSGGISPDAPRAHLTVSLADGAYAYGRALDTELKRRGVRTTGRVKAVSSSGRRRWLITDFSPPFVDVLAAMLQRRDDGDFPFLRESLLRVIAAENLATSGTRSQGVATIQTHLDEKVGVTRGAVILDGNARRIPAPSVVKSLRHVMTQFELAAEFELALGSASLAPALRHRLDDRLLRRVRAAAAVDDLGGEIAGFVTRDDGHRAAFALTVTGGGSADAHWNSLNQTLLAIVEGKVEGNSAAAASKSPPNSASPKPTSTIPLDRKVTP